MTAIPTDLLSMDIVQHTIGESSNILDDLCMSSKIQMWSRMKPVILEEDFPVRNTSYRWWEGRDHNCGIDYKGAQAPTVEQVVTKYTADGKNGYVYQRPYGTSKSPWRLGDFDGYLHEAKAPIHGFTCTGITDNEQGSKIRAQVAYALTSDTTKPGSLTMSEIKMWIAGQPADLGNLYFGLALVQNGSLIRYGTSNKKGVPEAEISSYALNEGKYIVYPFLSDIYHDGKTTKVGVCLTLPETKPLEVTIIGSRVTIYITAQWNYNMNTHEKMSISSTVEVKQIITPGGWTFKKNICRIRPAYKELHTPMGQYDKEFIIKDFNAPYNEFVRPDRFGYMFGGPFERDEAGNIKPYRVWISLDNGKYSKSILPAEDIEI